MNKLIPKGTTYSEIVNSKNFFTRLDILLSRKNMTLGRLQEEAGLAHGTLSVCRNRGNLPSAETMVRIADVLDTTLDYLLAGRLPTLENNLSPLETKVIERMREDFLLKAQLESIVG